MNVKTRQHVEKKIASAFITAALRDGKSISVNNGEDSTPYIRARNTSDTGVLTLPEIQYARKQILAQMFQTDEEHLMIGGIGNRPEGWVFLVYGNDGYDVISDYTVNLEYLMAEPNRLSDKYEVLYVR